MGQRRRGSKGEPVDQRVREVCDYSAANPDHSGGRLVRWAVPVGQAIPAGQVA